MDTSVRSHSVLGRVLTSWSENGAAPAVLLIDEIDSLVGDTLISVLRQLRAGYSDRPGGFPQSVILSGVRDVRDYRIRASSEKDLVAGGSAFNIKAKSLRLGDFDRDEVTTLLGQHTTATGQEFAPRAVATVWEQTRGQPWLVNALAQEMCFEYVGKPRRIGRPVNVDDVFEARETLIRRRETHIDQLADKLREPRVRRVIEPMLSGGNANHADRDLEYVRDLGLVALDSPLRIANPVYTEVVPRRLTSVLQDEIRQRAAWYVGRDGGLDMKGTSNNCRVAGTEACVTPRGLAGQRRGTDRFEYRPRTLCRKTCNGRLRRLRFLLSGTGLGAGAQRGGPIRQRVSTR